MEVFVSPELEQKLIDKYPQLFTASGGAPSSSPVALGFECGDGWFDLIDILSAQLSELDPVDEGDGAHPIRAVQVKEKYGTLRFYVGVTTNEATALIDFAEALSARICETCGNRGRRYGTAWLKTLCASCARQQGYPSAGVKDLKLAKP